MANITFVNDINDTQIDNINLGTINNQISFKFQIWNNRYGVNDTSNLPSSSKLYLKFQNNEEILLAKRMHIKIDNMSRDIIINENDFLATVDIDKELSGSPNNGDESNVDSFVNIELILDEMDGFKEGLKSLSIYIKE